MSRPIRTEGPPRRRSLPRAVRRSAPLLACTWVLIVLGAQTAAAGGAWVTYDLPDGWTEVTNATWPDSRFNHAGDMQVTSYWYSDDSPSAGMAEPYDAIRGNIIATIHDDTCADCIPTALPEGLDDFATMRTMGGTEASPPMPTTLGGVDGYSRTRTGSREEDDGCGMGSETWFWLPTSTGAITVEAIVGVSRGYQGEDLGTRTPVTGCDVLPARYDQILAETQSILDSMQFNYPGAGGAAAPTDAGPWRTAVGGIAAVAAAATALVGALTGGSTGATGRREENPVDPTTPIGYVLNLSTARIGVGAAAGPAEPLAVRAYAVFRDGTFRAAPHVPIQLAPPPGVSLSQTSGAGEVLATIAATGRPAAGAAIQITAASELGTTTAQVAIADEAQTRIATRFEPAPPAEGLDTLTAQSAVLVAWVEPGPSDPAVSAVQLAPGLTFRTTSRWLTLSPPAVHGAEAGVRVVAEQPDPSSPTAPPQGETVRVTVQIGQREIAADVVIPLAALPALDAKPDQVEFAAESGQSEDVAVWIDNSAGQDYEFTTLWREGSSPLADASIVKEGPTRARLTLTEASGPDGGDASDRPFVTATLIVEATTPRAVEPLRRHVEIIVAREGLFVPTRSVDPTTGAFWLRGDGTGVPTEFDLQAFVLDPASGKVTADAALAASATIEIGGEADTPGAVGLQVGRLTIEASGTRPVRPPSAIFNASLAGKLPTGPDPLVAALTASIPGRGDAFTASVPLRVRGVNMEPFSDSWSLEVERCRYVIDEFVPAEYRERLHALVNERSRTLGAEGLYAMRHQLWDFAQTLLVAEAHNHLDDAWWYQQVEDTLAWASWCGDIALGVLSGTGPMTMGALAMSTLKEPLVDVVTVWINGGSVDDWLANRMGTLTGIVEGILTDPDMLAKLPGQSKALAWTLFVSYYFVKELIDGKSVTEAMKTVARQLRDELLIRFLQHHAGKPARAGAKDTDGTNPDTDGTTPDADGTAPPRQPADGPPPPKGTPDAPPPPPPPRPDAPPPPPPPPPPVERTPRTRWPEGDARTRAEAMARELAEQTADGRPVDAATVDSIMRDPDAMRDLRRNHPELWQEFHEVRDQIYERHDAELSQWISDNVPEARGRDVVIETVGTRDGVDRDYRAGYVVDDPNLLRRRFIEIPRREWATQSERIFAEGTGGPTDPAGARQWARDHQQLATDYSHAEASVDMSDQATVWNEETGRWERTQVVPNLHLVEHGRSTLLDPEGLGSTYTTKVMESYAPGNHHDAYRQATKAIDTLDACREGYVKQDYTVTGLPPKVDAGMEIIRQVDAGDITPDVADARLAELDYTGGLPDFMKALSGQFASLGHARKA